MNIWYIMTNELDMSVSGKHKHVNRKKDVGIGM